MAEAEEVVEIDLAIMGSSSIDVESKNENLETYRSNKNDFDEDDLLDITEETNFIEEVVFSEGSIKDNILKYTRKFKKRYILLILYILILLFLVFAFLLLLSIYLTENGYVMQFLTFIENIGYYGNILMALIIVPTMLPLVPGYWMLALACGFLYGLYVGTATVLAGVQIGTISMYVFIRLFARKKMEGYMLSKGGIKMKAFLLELHRHQIVFSFLLRYMPIPMGVQTCLLSISPVPLWKIIITSFVALLTKIIPLVYIGTTARTLADVISGNVEFTTMDLVILIVGFFGLLAIVIFFIFLGRRTVRRIKLIQQTLENDPTRTTEKNIELETHISTPPRSSLPRADPVPPSFSSSLEPPDVSGFVNNDNHDADDDGSGDQQLHSDVDKENPKAHAASIEPPALEVKVSRIEPPSLIANSEGIVLDLGSSSEEEI